MSTTEKATYRPRHILITGASGGLGQALALRYAAQGVFLSLWGRDAARLEALAAACTAKGAECVVIRQDIRELEASREKILELDAARPLTMAILNSGVSSGLLPQKKPDLGGLEPVADACRVMEVNALGAINLMAMLLEPMTARQAGHIVLIASLAALYPLPGSPGYSASKAALSFFARATRMALFDAGVRISIVYPGYIETPMSRRLKGPQPLRMTADAAAEHIASRLLAGKDTIIFPRLLALGTRLLHLLPEPLAAFFLRYFAFTVEPDRESPAYKGHSDAPPSKR